MTVNFETRCLPECRAWGIVERIATQHCLLQAWALLALDDLLNPAVITDRMSALYRNSIEGMSYEELAQIEGKQKITIRANLVKTMDRLINMAIQQIGVVQVGRTFNDFEIDLMKTAGMKTKFGRISHMEWSNAASKFRRQFIDSASQIFTDKQLNFLFELSRIKPIETFKIRMSQNPGLKVDLRSFHRHCNDVLAETDTEKILSLIVLEHFSEVVDIIRGIRDQALNRSFSEH